MIDLAEASALDIARAVRRGEITATAVIEAALARIEKLNPPLNAFTDVTAARARELAAAIDRRRGRGERRARSLACPSRSRTCSM